jgi:hypothetical protein
LTTAIVRRRQHDGFPSSASQRVPWASASLLASRESLARRWVAAGGAVSPTSSTIGAWRPPSSSCEARSGLHGGTSVAAHSPFIDECGTERIATRCVGAVADLLSCCSFYDSYLLALPIETNSNGSGLARVLDSYVKRYVSIAKSNLHA